MPWLRDWAWSWLFISRVRNGSACLLTSAYIWAHRGENIRCRGGWPVVLWCHKSINIFAIVFSLCTANKRTPGGPLLHHLHWLRSVHLLLDDHPGHICYIVVSNLNLINCRAAMMQEAEQWSFQVLRIKQKLLILQPSLIIFCTCICNSWLVIS